MVFLVLPASRCNTTHYADCQEFEAEATHARPRQWPEKLVADRGYDRKTFRHALQRRGIRMYIPPQTTPRYLEGKSRASCRGMVGRLNAIYANSACACCVGNCTKIGG